MFISCILAVDTNFGISKNNTIPWESIPEDIQFFRHVTINKIVVMGKNTFLSLPKRPLNNRINCVISSTLDKSELPENVFIFSTLKTCIDYLERFCSNIFIIGGSRLYNEALKSHKLKRVYLTTINKDFKTDNFIDNSFLNRPNTSTVLKDSSFKDIEYKIEQIDIHTNLEEMQYLNLLIKLIDRPLRMTRNEHTKSNFGYTLKFDLEKSFPMLTTKKVYWKGIAEELLFFIKGKTDSNILSEKKVKIWNPNTSREFLDGCGLHRYDIGDMGPMYGWNWRHFGAEYKNKDTDYTNKGFDQLKDVLYKLTHDKNSRRIVMTAFDPSKVSDAVLPPCHSMVLQFYVDENRLSLQMYQRSSDSFLGLPFNISQHALLLRLICEVTNLKPDKLIIQLGDYHIYEAHLDAVKTQLNRCTYRFPQLEILKKFEGDINDIDAKIKYLENIRYEDLSIKNYSCGSIIKADMVA